MRRRALRVDVIGRRLAPAGLLRDLHRGHPKAGLDVVLAGSPALATFVGEQTRLAWAAGYGLRRIAVHDPPRSARTH